MGDPHSFIKYFPNRDKKSESYLNYNSKPNLVSRENHYDVNLPKNKTLGNPDHTNAPKKHEENNASKLLALNNYDIIGHTFLMLPQ